MNKTLFILVLVLVLGAGGYLIMKKNPTPAPIPVESTQPTETKQAGQTTEFQVEGGMYYFKPNEIRVKKGDTVKIVFNNKEGMHDWVLDEFKAKTQRIKTGESEAVSFVADKVGTFEYYCSVGNHRAMGMKGNFIVE
jgi:plastocyanin